MRKTILIAAILSTGCVGAPAYQSPSIHMAPTYGVATRAPALRAQADTCPQDSSIAEPATSVHFSSALSNSPFWQTLGDSVLTALIEDALRANTDVRIAETRLTSSRAERRLAMLDLAPTVTASGSAVRQQLSIAQLPGATRQLPL